MEVIDLLIINAWEEMHVATAILSRSFALRGSAAVQKERGVREAYLDSHKGKQMLTNSQLQQHEEG